MKQHPLFSHLIEVRCLGDLAPITPKVIPRDVVGDEEYEIRLFGLSQRKEANSREENKKAFHKRSENGKKIVRLQIQSNLLSREC
jgi:hypothetical protein